MFAEKGNELCHPSLYRQIWLSFLPLKESELLGEMDDIDFTKALDCVYHNKLRKILQEMGIPDHLIYLLRNLCAGQETTVRTAHGTTDWFQIKQEYVKAVYCHPAYLTSMQSTSCKMQGWMKHKLESRLLGEIPTVSICR